MRRVSRSERTMIEEKNRHCCLIPYAFLVGIGIRLLMGLQGFDYVDMGFCMTFYQNIFSHPEAMPFYFNYYLTGLIGGLWQAMLGDWGLQGFRLLDVLARTAAIWMLYLTFRDFIPSKRIAALTVLLAFLFPTYIITFHYNTSTLLLMSVAIWLFSSAYRQKSMLLLFAAGVALGITLFARSVNLAMLPLIALPLLNLDNHSLKKRIVATVVHAGGLLTGLAVVWTLLAATHQSGYFLDGLNEAFAFFNTNESEAINTHTSGNIIWSYLVSWKNVLAQAVALLVICSIYVYATRTEGIKNKALKTVCIISLAVLTYTSLAYVTLLTVCLLLLVTAFCNGTIDKRILPALLYATIGALLFPIGSDMGIARIFNHSAQLLVFPATVCLTGVKAPAIKSLLPYGYACITLSAFAYLLFMPYEESEPRWKLTTMVQSKGLNVYTDSDKAAFYQDVIQKIHEYGQDSPTLLLANQSSELYYATGKQPFTGSTQVYTYNGSMLHTQLAKQEKFYGHLPMVVFLKIEESENETLARQELRPWLAEKKYKRIYEDTNLIIYKSNYETSI